MKIKTWLMSAVIASSSMMAISAHADNTTRVAATSALGSVVGTALGKQMGGQSGAMIGSALGGAGGAAVASNRRDRTSSAIGGGLGGVGGYTVGRNVGGTNGGYIGAALGAAGGSALGNKISKDRAEERYYDNGNHRGWKNITVTTAATNLSLLIPKAAFHMLPFCL